MHYPVNASDALALNVGEEAFADNISLAAARLASTLFQRQAHTPHITPFLRQTRRRREKYSTAAQASRLRT